VAWPATPDLASAVETRLEARPGGRAAPIRARLRVAPAWAIAAAVVLVLAGGVMAVPPARSAVLEWLGIASVRIERAEPPRYGADLQLGRAVTLEAARRDAGFPIGVPAALGEPDGVFVSEAPARVDFVYRRPYVLVTQFRAAAEPVIEKTLGENAALERLRVDGDSAYFISGAEHGFAYAGDGVFEFEPPRLAGNTLLVDRAREGVLLRIEGELTREQAVRIARSLS
jgi:hypothetical protein